MAVCRQWRNHLDINTGTEGQAALHYNCVTLSFPLELTPEEFTSPLFQILPPPHNLKHSAFHI